MATEDDKPTEENPPVGEHPDPPERHEEHREHDYSSRFDGIESRLDALADEVRKLAPTPSEDIELPDDGGEVDENPTHRPPWHKRKIF